MYFKPFKLPPPVQVYVTVQPYPNCGFTGAFTSRIGTCADESGIAKIIADDRKAMGDTMGGLIEPVSTKGRSYRAFRAVWTEVAI